MNIKIGENIRRLRKERNITQEVAANHLGISFQSISKWERGDGYPDITMIPTLARYFGVSVDELMGMDCINAENELRVINEKWMDNRMRGAHRENVELMRASLREYPNDPLLLVQLSASLERIDGTETEKREYLRQSIEVQEQILNYCGDCEVRGATLFNIAHSYLKYGDREKALEYAEKLPNIYKARENAMVLVLRNDEKRRETAKSALEPLMWSLALHLNTLAEIENDPAYRDKILQIIDVLFKEDESEVIRSIREKAQD